MKMYFLGTALSALVIAFAGAESSEYCFPGIDVKVGANGETFKQLALGCAKEDPKLKTGTMGELMGCVNPKLKTILATDKLVETGELKDLLVKLNNGAEHRFSVDDFRKSGRKCAKDLEDDKGNIDYLKLFKCTVDSSTKGCNIGNIFITKSTKEPKQPVVPVTAEKPPPKPVSGASTDCFPNADSVVGFGGETFRQLALACNRGVPKTIAEITHCLSTNIRREEGIADSHGLLVQAKLRTFLEKLGSSSDVIRNIMWAAESYECKMNKANINEQLSCSFEATPIDSCSLSNLMP